MHLYVGIFLLAEIAGIVSLSRAELAFLRTQIDFMMPVDAMKASFGRYFSEETFYVFEPAPRACPKHTV
ncbi:MAG: hypothetical protein HWN68_17445 [Desulfobacterales bacterium]|nr:hypothetical protein [Desulfobacterales bacterium]